MTGQPIRNMAASVRQRLLDRSRARGEDYQYLLQRYASERFLYRLGQSPHRDRYVLKGAMLFALWGGSSYRPTRDLDFTGYGGRAAGEILDAISEICTIAVPDDGIAFELTTLIADPIRDGSEYQGFRVKFQARLGTARIPMQVDIGFGNAIETRATEVEYPVLLDAPSPRIRAYPQQAVVAEKLHAMVVLGDRNSRFKDFYDLHVLALQFPFDGVTLASAVAATFARRRTPVDAALPAALTPRFFGDDARAAQWRAYLTRNALPGAPLDFAAVGELLISFLGPVWNALAAGRALADAWSPGDRWPSATFADEVAPGRLTTEVTDPAQGSEVRTGRRRFKPYPAYKDSSVEWLGEIPAHWVVKRLKHLARLNPESLPDDTDPMLAMVYVDIGGVDTLGRIAEPEPITFASAPSRARRVVRNGDVIVSTVRTYLRAIAPIKDPELGMVVSTGFAVVRPNDTLRTDYAAYALRAPYFVERVVANSKGVSFPAINESEMATYELAEPPLDEQRTIAAFLDHETARIDTLVGKKERLIELLQEKRTALITRAVTKGLDPNVPMKDSGVEWLGDIPTHWESLALSRVALSRCDGPFGSGLKSEHYSGTGVRVVRLQNIGWTEFLDTDRAYIDEDYAGELGDHSVSAGDLLIAGLGDEGHPVGRACVAPEGIGPAMVKADCFRFRLDQRRIVPLFAAYQLSATALAAAGSVATGATRARMNLTLTATRKIALPPLDEQHVILDVLDRQSERQATLVTRIREAIDRFKELRTALISAAVTGKIDVREEAS